MNRVISMQKFKTLPAYKKYSNNVCINMNILGFVEIGWCDVDKGEKCKQIAEDLCESRKWDNGFVVWHRRLDGWQCPIVNVFYKENKQ